MSPTLTDEMRHLVGQGVTVQPSAAELRVEYASLLGWVRGLVIGILSQLEASRASVASLTDRRASSSS